MASRAPRLFGFVYRIGDRLSSPRHKSPVYYANTGTAKKLKAYLEENAFDGIVTFHLFPAQMITYLKRTKCAVPPTVAVFTDYTCIPFWEETECDYYIIPHEQLLPENRKRGLPAEKLLPYGIPVGMDFCAKTDKAIAASFGVTLALFPELYPFAALAFFYIFFSTVVIIRPHLYRSVVTFICFTAAVCAAVPARALRLGCAMISCITISKHVMSRGQEEFSVQVPRFRR